MCDWIQKKHIKIIDLTAKCGARSSQKTGSQGNEVTLSILFAISISSLATICFVADRNLIRFFMVWCLFPRFGIFALLASFDAWLGRNPNAVTSSFFTPSVAACAVTALLGALADVVIHHWHLCGAQVTGEGGKKNIFTEQKQNLSQKETSCPHPATNHQKKS